MEILILFALFAFPALISSCTLIIINSRVNNRKKEVGENTGESYSLTADIIMVIVYSVLSGIVPLLSPYRLEFLGLFRYFGLNNDIILFLLVVLPIVLLLPVLIIIKKALINDCALKASKLGTLRIVMGSVFLVLYVALFVYMLSVKISHPQFFGTPG